MARARRERFGLRAGEAPPPRSRRRWLSWMLPAAVAALLAVAQPAVASVPSADASPTASPGASPSASPGASPSTSSSAAQASSTSGSLGARIAKIALSQVGNGDNPVVTNFNGLNCNPYSTMVAGFSANSDGCGDDSTFNVRNSNENWCADFAKWVWQQAGVTQDMNTINAAASSFVQWALDDGQNPVADSGTPVVGDAVVFFHAGDITPARYADHVGIVVAVNADGTVDMVNGDFSSSTNVKVEHDVNLDLTTFAHNTWSSGEVWALVSPPTAAQHANPRASVSGPSTAVVGSEAEYRADGSERGGSMTGYYWTFGDGRATNSNGARVTHTFATPGMHTITVTATSSFGTVTTVTKNVNVVGASASVAAVPSTETWYSSYPVSYYRFVRSGSGSTVGLAADVWDGASWLQLQAAGTPASSGAIAALSYIDPEVDSATTPHAYYRAADGSLAESYLGASGWVSKDLPGAPAAGADIVAAYTASGPAVFFVDAHGRLSETSEASGTWSTRTLSNFDVQSSPLALAETADGPTLFAVARGGALVTASQAGRAWPVVPSRIRVSEHATLSALTTPDGAASVVVNGVVSPRSKGAPTLVQLTQRSRGAWGATALPGTARVGAIAASTYELPSAVSGPIGDFPNPPGTLVNGPTHRLGTVVAYLSAHGAPAVTYNDGTGWHTAALPGTATAITGIAAEPIAHQPLQVYVGTASGPAMDTTGDTAPPSGPWTTRALPSTPATFADRVLLYSAGSGDLPAAQAAASAAGLASSQVTTSYQVAWAATLSGDHFVIAVGQAALNALEYNTCGWTNPSAVDPGSTPFDYVTRALNVLPGADLFMNGASSTEANTQQRAIDMAYYAVHGALPSGQTALPAAVASARTCLGAAS
ncbi:PKD domain-containing protein [Humibacter ginsenosidimutans]|uniref:PKD domain-containing protein n=1 Tax=Humibacter ginsenosidimutans TaxID=2599293 RepID=UPI00143D7C6A|nr:PKD domain-containing protein [Humibacter ginsenosidimutans]